MLGSEEGSLVDRQQASVVSKISCTKKSPVVARLVSLVRKSETARAQVLSPEEELVE